jgi:hypothetical protein
MMMHFSVQVLKIMDIWFIIMQFFSPGLIIMQLISHSLYDDAFFSSGFNNNGHLVYNNAVFQSRFNNNAVYQCRF